MASPSHRRHFACTALPRQDHQPDDEASVLQEGAKHMNECCMMVNGVLWLFFV